MLSPAIDRAVFLQQRAEPGDIVLSGETAATGLIELGGLAPLPEALFGPNAFSWRAARQSQPCIRSSAYDGVIPGSGFAVRGSVFTVSSS